MTSAELAVISYAFMSALSEGIWIQLATLIIIRADVMNNWHRFTAFAAGNAIVYTCLWYVSMVYSTVVPVLAVYVLFLFLMFRWLYDSSNRSAMLSMIIFSFFSLISTLLSFIGAAVAGNNPASFFTFQASYETTVIWLLFDLAMPLAAYYIGLRLSANLVAIRFQTGKIKSSAAILFLINIQIFLIAAILLVMGQHLELISRHFSYLALLFCFAAVLICMLILLRQNGSLSLELDRVRTYNQLSQEMSGFLLSLSQQHADFTVHIDKMHELAIASSFNDLNEYMASLNQGIGTMNEALKTANPFLSALLNAKHIEAGRRSIRLTAEISSPVDGDMVNQNNLELIRIIGNLINNALDAVENLDKEHRWITIRIDRLGPLLRFAVSNPLSANMSLNDDIFTRGNTGKGGEHSGLGLYIARSLAEKMGGMVKFGIEPGPEVVFTLLMPR